MARVKKKYIVTDSCFFYDNKQSKRNPHWIELVDVETGSVKTLKSGSIIQIVRERK